MYSNEQFPHYVRMAGKVTILTAVVGFTVFLFAFMFNLGTQELQRVSAQTATTTLTVLNTPPSFTIGAYEVTESSENNPTNSGDVIEWTALGGDSNGAPYFLLICNTNASPTANAAPNASSLGTAPPECGAGAVQWGVSTATVSDTYATVSTTVTEGSPFAETNDWYAWVCDDDPTNPRCNNTPVQGLNATNSSPFYMNRRPVLTSVSNDGPVDPGAVLTFNSTSSDPDSVGGEDELVLVVCGTNTDYDPLTNTCPNDLLASTTISVTDNATATYTLAAIVRDDTYAAYAYLIDEHGHEASANPIQADFDVNNIAPVVLGGDIILNGGNDIELTVPGGETPSSTLAFAIRDANSCMNAASGPEITDFTVAVFRSSYGTSTCDTTAGSYNENYCYPSGAAPSSWNLTCAATTTCASPLEDTVEYLCEFPLWHVADPTDAGPNTPTAFATDTWTAAVAGVDDDNATGTLATTSSPVELLSFSSIDIIDSEIAYGGIEPGFDTGTLRATSTVLNVGNTGIDQEVRGDSMCGTYSVGTPCAVSATSTIPADQQQFADSQLAYNDPAAVVLDEVTNNELELNVAKTTVPASPQQGTTYWGIAVPASITLAGDYRGLNTFTAVTAEAVDW